MKSSSLYRIAAGVFILFAAGHTFGFLTFRPATIEGRAVLDAMNHVQFTQNGETFSYGGFYKGFGLSISLTILFEAFLAWLLSRHPQRTLGWAFCALQIANIPLSLMYFASVPAIFTGVVAALLGWAAFAINREASPAHASRAQSAPAVPAS